ncbi:translation initiation factor IF-2-like [Orcinus orca]|uniref:translation initiation factor IF-2-like n=1 Tax=Orcinus orca TaxID=9733 RepID=UPI001440F160|nr:translation initiation factor IF-2-like [Orcinus orca]
MLGRRRQPLASMTGPRGSRGPRPPPAPPGAYPSPGRRRPAGGPGQPRRRVLPGSELRPRKAPPFRAHGCRADSGQRPAGGCAPAGDMCLYFFLSQRPRRGRRLASGSRPVLPGGVTRGRQGVDARGQPGGGRSWLLCPRAGSSGTIYFEDSAPSSPGVRQHPRKVCSSTLAHPEYSSLKTVGALISSSNIYTDPYHVSIGSVV